MQENISYQINDYNQQISRDSQYSMPLQSMIMLGHVSRQYDTHITTFRQCLQQTFVSSSRYQKRVFILMAFYWIASSFFLCMPFYLFKPVNFKECTQYDFDCIQLICQKYPDTVIDHIQFENTYSYKFHLFCGKQFFRFLYKLAPETFSVIGLLFYGFLADKKGRMIAFKISWRLFTLGVIVISLTQTQFLITFGYLIASINCFPSLIIQIVLLFQQSSQKMRMRVSLLLLSCLFVGPLFLSFFSYTIFNAIGIRLTLGIFCAIPSFIIALFINKIKQSAIFAYKNDKISAFNIINIILLTDKKRPILIDLAQSRWIKQKDKIYTIYELIKIQKIRTKLFIGMLFVSVSYLNIKEAQTSLDSYIESQLRGMFMNISTSLADITLCILIIFIKRSCFIPCVVSIILMVTKLLALEIFSEDQSILSTSIILIEFLIRYFNQMVYGMILIWSVQTFPTQIRMKGCGFVFCGCAFGTILAYSLKDFPKLIGIFQIILTITVIFMQKFVKINGDGIMYDTIKNTHYDKKDKFYRY